jgi:hypothetical protein
MGQFETVFIHLAEFHARCPMSPNGSSGISSGVARNRVIQLISCPFSVSKVKHFNLKMMFEL